MTMWKASGDLGAVPAGPAVPVRWMSASTTSSAMTTCSRTMRIDQRSAPTRKVVWSALRP